MSEVSVQTATLICGERPLSNGGADYIVNGLVLPDGEMHLARTMYSTTSRMRDVALRWPTAMLENMVEYYDRYIREGVREYYDCYTFGAAILGLSSQVVYNERRQPENITKGQPAHPAHLQNTQPYGVFPRRGSPTHLMIGTQYPDACLHVTGRYGHVAITSARDTARFYRGALHAARTPDTKGHSQDRAFRIGQLIRG